VFLGDTTGHETNHHEKLGLTGISCASQFAIPDTAGTSPDVACHNTHTVTAQAGTVIPGNNRRRNCVTERRRRWKTRRKRRDGGGII